MAATSTLSSVNTCIICEKITDNKCSKCKTAYCSKEHQKSDWTIHKKVCKYNPYDVEKEYFEMVKAVKKIGENFHNFSLLFQAEKMVRTFSLRGKLKEIKLSKENELISLIFYLGLSPAELYEHFHALPNMKIIKKSKNFDDNHDQCSNFVFKNSSWYRNEDRDLVSNLFSTYEKSALFLKSKGYEEVDIPQAGDIVQYSTYLVIQPDLFKINEDPIAAHYGKVVRVEKDKITIRSKFGQAHIFEHDINIVQNNFGSVYTF